MNYLSTTISRYTLISIALFTYCAPAFCQTNSLGSARIVSFTPQGDVSEVRQVVVQFSEAMIPFGSPHAQDAPFDIKCEAKGRARWADQKSWVFDFAKGLPAGLRCVFSLKEDTRTLINKPFTGKKNFEFSTGGPTIQMLSPYSSEDQEEVSDSYRIGEDQAFIVRANGDVSQETILKNVRILVEGIESPVSVRIVGDDERKAVLKSQNYEDGDSSIWILQPVQNFPADKKITFVWGKGVASVSGIVTEADQIFSFKSRPIFRADISCQRINKTAKCLPIGSIEVRFSAPIPSEIAKGIALTGDAGKIYQQRIGDENDNLIEYVEFVGPFPENAKLFIKLPDGEIQDDSGRELSNVDKFPLEIETSEYPPLAKFQSKFGIVEYSNNEAFLPVTLRNLEPEVLSRLFTLLPNPDVATQVSAHVSKIEEDFAVEGFLEKVQSRDEWQDRDKSIFVDYPPQTLKKVDLAKPNGAKPFEVVGIKLDKPGFYVVELESLALGSALLGKPQSMFVSTGVLATNLAVHFKWGRESSLVWVTSLDKAQPVAGAIVSINDCHKNSLGSGQTDAYGILRLGKIPGQSELRDCGNLPSIFVSARYNGDMSFVTSRWDEGIESWRYNLPTTWYQSTDIQAHTVLARNLLRQRDKVNMKHFIRHQTMDGFTSLTNDELPDKVTIRHLGSDKTYELPLVWDQPNSSESTWQVPQDATLGEYSITLSRGDSTSAQSGTFRVEAFRVPLIQAKIKAPAEPLVMASMFSVDVNAKYLAGGPAAKLPIKFRSTSDHRYTSFPGDFDGFLFDSGPVKVGRSAPGGEQSSPDANKIDMQNLTLDEYGAASIPVNVTNTSGKSLDVTAEMEFRDPNGEIQTVSQRIPVWTAANLVGVKAKSWAFSKGTISCQVAVVDTLGKPVPGASVKVSAFERKSYSNRKRLVGGFYAYENSYETIDHGALCGGSTDGRGLLSCEAKSPLSGNVVLQAEVTDSAQRTSFSNTSVWVSKDPGDNFWFEQESDDRIDVLPEKKSYEPGETARFQVRMPFRQATALVSIEREGIKEVFVQELSGEKPVIQIPIEDSYAPNVFVSVLAVRGRVSDIQPTSTLDLGKPAFKLGVGEINVGWKAHELTVSLKTERDVYKIRENAKVHIAVSSSDGRPIPADTEVALAAVDEGLLELLPNTTWDLLSAMMGRRSYWLKTFTNQMQVVGKRHFGLKAVPTGGGGGKSQTRELFDTLLLWQGKVKLDATGQADIEVPLNDSLTSFRVVGIASADIGKFGSGSTTIRATADLMVLSGIAPLVRQGDVFKATFTLRNTTSRVMEVKSSLKIEGLIGDQPVQQISLNPGESKDASWGISVPAEVDHLKYTLESEEGDKIIDRLAITQKVVPVVPVAIWQATLDQISGKDIKLPVEKPVDAVDNRGGVKVELQRTLGAGLSGLQEHMRTYPYTCMEQKVSKAVALGDKDEWQKLQGVMPQYISSNGLLCYFPGCKIGNEVLTSYILAVVNEAGFEIDKALQTRLSNGLADFLAGRVSMNSSVVQGDLQIRKLQAIEALSRYGLATVEQFNSIPDEPNLLPTAALIDWVNVLARVKGLPKASQRLAAAKQMLRARFNFQGTVLTIGSQQPGNLWWLMISNDVTVLKALLSNLEFHWAGDDTARLVRGALERQKQGRWDLTTANAWGSLAVKKFSEKFEKVAPGGDTIMTLADQHESVSWAVNPEGKAVELGWPVAKQDLRIHHQGVGRPWAIIQSLAAIAPKEMASSGYTIKRELVPVEQKIPGKWSVGDIMTIKLEIDSQAERTWVVVNDPIPAGATILGGGLRRDTIATQTKAEDIDLVWWKGDLWTSDVFPAYTEQGFESYRAYYEYFPKGSTKLEYNLRLNGAGEFKAPGTRVEAMYSPEMYGQLGLQNVVVGD